MKLFLPSYNKRGWVIVDPGKLTLENATDRVRAIVETITSWNFETQITEDTVRDLPLVDIDYIYSAVSTNQEFSGLSNEDIKELTVYLSAVQKGQEIDVSIPFAYKLYLYRKNMNISYPELCKTPLRVIIQDLQFMNIEQQMANN